MMLYNWKVESLIQRIIIKRSIIILNVHIHVPRNILIKYILDINYQNSFQKNFPEFNSNYFFKATFPLSLQSRTKTLLNLNKSVRRCRNFLLLGIRGKSLIRSDYWLRINIYRAAGLMGFLNDKTFCVWV